MRMIRVSIPNNSGVCHPMSCTISQLILESIRTWMGSTQSLKVLAGIEMRWIEIDALAAWPALEEFLAIIFFERQRGLEVGARAETGNLTADEATLLISLIVARWDGGRRPMPAQFPQ